MRKSRFTEEQIAAVMKEAEAGVPVAELSRMLGITDAAFYRWKANYGGAASASPAPAEALSGGDHLAPSATL